MKKALLKTNLLVFLLASIPFNTQSMDKPSKTKQLINLATATGQIMLGKLPRKYLSDNKTQFNDLPEDVVKVIVLVNLEEEAQSIRSSMQIIADLSSVNKKLHELFNNPQFCLNLIKRFSSRYNLSNELVCKQFPTESAHKRNIIQKSLYALCQIEDPSANHFKDLLQSGADLQYTYGDGQTFKTPLIVALEKNSHAASFIIKELQDKKIVFNKPNVHGETPLMLAAQNNNISVIRLLCTIDPSNINHQDAQGNTAFMQCLMQISGKDNLEIAQTINTLLHFGADPEIANNDGLTPLDVAKIRKNDVLVALVESAIEFKN